MLTCQRFTLKDQMDRIQAVHLSSKLTKGGTPFSQTKVDRRVKVLEGGSTLGIVASVVYVLEERAEVHFGFLQPWPYWQYVILLLNN